MKLNRSTNRNLMGKSWFETVCCLDCTCLQFFWHKVVMRKWMNISAQYSDYSADDTDEDDDDDDDDVNTFDTRELLPRPKRQKSETFRAQYINEKELKICTCTWNVGGKLPPDDLNIEGWLDINDPADMYVIGFQEIIPLNACNVIGAEDTRPVPEWENIIRETLDRIQTGGTKYKCYTDPPSHLKFEPSANTPDEGEISLETDCGCANEEEIYLLTEEPNIDEVSDEPVASLTWRGNVNNSIRASDSDLEASVSLLDRTLTKTYGGTERMGGSRSEPPLDHLAQCSTERPYLVRASKSFKASKFSKRSLIVDNRVQPELVSLAETNVESLIESKRKSQYVRIVSKQMVGLFLSIWVRRSLRRHIQNVNVSTVGVGVMGYLGNKGSISVSMSIFQTLFCFICTHLTSGEKETEAIKRNADVHEIHRRTHFSSYSSIRPPKSIHDHERIIWLGDLNYRINLSYETTRQLISKKEWSKLVEYDQLIQEFRKGRTFDGWSEGTLNFPPTYKYKVYSEMYYGDDPKMGRRTPAWCDRILSYGKGIRLMSYTRTELMISDHRPVSALYMVDTKGTAIR